ncbi:tellurite resistance TerB family protein [Pararhodobacter zhoushanensis]|uniref:TerB family tellurite resistance protein n=1 Tax=Pararhodobacter zhoushanensis TaxID=2479545 RepID=A0ABT3H250_9RHOB|nr:TerB family tellurite resistance protein [Pararhodobacter zhoushanensis]MCW1933874.1 TerB family tellurite resistance protein [Pararhodobacter zhoushanensis]
MIDVFKSLFRSDAAARAEVSPQIAVAALLVDAARADGVYAPDESDAVAALLAAIFSLTPAEARALRAQGEVAQGDAPDIVRFTRVIKFALEEDQRIQLIEALWSVVLVDHQRDPNEDALLRRLPPLIAVSDHDSAAARQRVLARHSA